MPATTFEVAVSIDEDVLRDKDRLLQQQSEIVLSFVASLGHWIAEQRLELKP